MDSALNKPNLLRFGILKVDLKTCEPSKAGMKHKVPPNPLQVFDSRVVRFISQVNLLSYVGFLACDVIRDIALLQQFSNFVV